jgi:hypothetical protein
MLPLFQINKRLFNAEVMDEDLTSEVIDISELIGFAVHSIWTGTPAGNIIVQASNDGSNFVNIDTQAAGGAAGQDLVNIDRAHYRYVRVFYDFTSSTGALSVYLSGKRG